MQSNYDRQIDTARQIFLGYDIARLAEKFSLELDDEYMHIEYIGEPYLIERATGSIYMKTAYAAPDNAEQDADATEYSIAHGGEYGDRHGSGHGNGRDSERNSERDSGRDSEPDSGRGSEQGNEKGGENYAECRSYNTVLTIYDMLCHSGYDELPTLSGQWMPVSGFAIAGTSPDANVFAQRYADSFSGRIPQLREACERAGGELLEPLAGADVTARIPAFPFFPVMFQFWEGDDEFAPQIRILWDKKTMDFLRFETTYYLQGDILEKLAVLMEPGSESMAASAPDLYHIKKTQSRR